MTELFDHHFMGRGKQFYGHLCSVYICLNVWLYRRPWLPAGPHLVSLHSLDGHLAVESQVVEDGGDWNTVAVDCCQLLPEAECMWVAQSAVPVRISGRPVPGVGSHGLPAHV